MPIERYLEAVLVPHLRIGQFTEQLAHARYPVLGGGAAGARPGLGSYNLSNFNPLAGAPYNIRDILVTAIMNQPVTGAGNIGVTESIDVHLEAADETTGTGATRDDTVAEGHMLGRAVGTVAGGASSSVGVTRLPFPIFMRARTRIRAGTASNDNSGTTDTTSCEFVRPELVPPGTLVLDPAGTNFGHATTYTRRGYRSTHGSVAPTNVTAGTAGAYGTASAVTNYPQAVDTYVVGITQWIAGGVSATNCTFIQTALLGGGSAGTDRVLCEVRGPVRHFSATTGRTDSATTMLTRPIFVKAGTALAYQHASSAAHVIHSSLIIVNAWEVVPIEAVIGRNG